MKRRRLSSDEVALWRQVAEQAEPLNPAKQIKAAAKPTPALAPKRRAIEPFSIGDASLGAPSEHRLLPSLSDNLKRSPVKMDQKAFGRMKRGKLVPERKIDLHGMTVAQAHPTLRGFIQSAHADGLRLVLVITGKGQQKTDDGPIPTRRGILKNQVPQWLTMAPLAPLVLQVSEAHLRHGGSGAYYVYLRRIR